MESVRREGDGTCKKNTRSFIKLSSVDARTTPPNTLRRVRAIRNSNLYRSGLTSASWKEEEEISGSGSELKVPVKLMKIIGEKREAGSEIPSLEVIESNEIANVFVRFIFNLKQMGIVHVLKAYVSYKWAFMGDFRIKVEFKLGRVIERDGSHIILMLVSELNPAW